MALQSSGAISLSDIGAFYGDAAPYSMSEYFGKGGAPGSGAISAANFYGKRQAAGGAITDYGGYRLHQFNGSGTFTLYASKTITYLIVAGGGAGPGSGGGGRGRRSGKLGDARPGVVCRDCGRGGIGCDGIARQ